MAPKPTYEELEQRVKELENESTKRRLEETTLRERNNQLRLLTDNSPAYLAFIGADDLCYHYVNKEYEAAFSLPRKDIIGKHIEDIIGESNYRFALKYIEAVKSGEPVSNENTFNVAQEKRWIRVNYVPDFDEQNRVKG